MKADDFDRRFEEQQKLIHEYHGRLRRYGIFFSLVNLAIGVSLVGFAVWVIVKFMQHFGVV